MVGRVRESAAQKSKGSKVDFEGFERMSLLELYAHLNISREYHVFSEGPRELDEYFLRLFTRFLNKLNEEPGVISSKRQGKFRAEPQT